MNETEERYFLWNIEELKQLNENTTVVRHRQSGELMIRKRITESNTQVFERLTDVRHKNLCSVLKVVCEDENAYAFCEYASGCSLQFYLDSGREFSEEETLKIVSQICDGLNVLHSVGVIHRDITCANIILSSDGNVKIIDYGIARIPKDDVRRDTCILGTAGYAAPEQFGFSQTDKRSDIYSVGVLMNVLLTGSLPSEKLCDGKLGKIISRCISIDSEKRFANILELQEVLFGKKFEPKKSTGLPGFRGDNKAVYALASLGYASALIYSVLFAWLAFASRGIGGCIAEFFNCIFSIGVPYCLILNPFDIQSKIKFFKSCDRRKKYAVICLGTVLSLVISFLVFLIIFGEVQEAQV